jgi:hypothetical protein
MSALPIVLALTQVQRRVLDKCRCDSWRRKQVPSPDHGDDVAVLIGVERDSWQ